MAKENIVTGKTEEVDSMKSNKVSIVNASTPIRKPKVSQFCVQHRWIYNYYYLFLIITTFLDIFLDRPRSILSFL